MAIPKMNLKEFLKENKGYKVLKRCTDTTIIKLPNGELLKILDKSILDIISNTGYDLETRLCEVDKLTTFTKFAWPTIMLEDEEIVSAYLMPNIQGVDFTDYYENIFDLTSYAKIHSQIQDNIKSGNDVGIVFPDLCTTENIRVTSNHEIFFIDYDSLQIKNMPAVGFSSDLGTPDAIMNEKYYDSELDLFTNNLDIRSSIFLYFLDVFGVNLSKVGIINPATFQRVTLDDIFSLINLDDYDVQQKVWKLFQPSIPNEFLGDDVYKLANKYDLVMTSPELQIKRLIKK